MSVTFTYTLQRVQKMGTEQVMDWLVNANGTYVTGGGSFTVAQLGLDVVDFISVAIDGSYEATSTSTVLVAPDLTNFKWVMFGSGGADTHVFDEIGSGQSVNMQFIARCWGVA